MFEFQRILFEKAPYDRAPGFDLVETSACGFGRVQRKHTASDGAGWSGQPAAAAFTVSPLPGPTGPSSGPDRRGAY